MAILEYRDSPINDTGLSPAQRFLGRRLKTRLPTATALLKPQHADEIRKSLKQRQLKQKYYYDKHAGKTDLKLLKSGENVVMRHRNNWKHGTVRREHESPRSYVIQTPYRRNRKHLKATKSLPLQEESDEELVVQPTSYQQQVTSEQPETSEPPE